jgi:hypothetical protein
VELAVHVPTRWSLPCTCIWSSTSVAGASPSPP